MQNIYESLAGWIIGILIGCLDKISVLSIYAFSPQLMVLKNLFPGAAAIYRTFIYISICLAIVILLFRITVNIFTPNSKDYEPYSVLLGGFVRYCVLMMVLPAVISFSLSFSNTVYWGLAEEIYPEITEDNSGIEGCFEGIYDSLAAQFGDSGTAEYGDTAAEDTLAGKAGAGAGFILGILDSANRLMGNTLLADSIENLREAIDPTYRVPQNGGTVGAIIAAFLTIYLGWNYLMFLLEAAERYIVMAVLIICMPLGLAPSVSKQSESITKRYFSMFFSQLIILVFTAVFLAMFQYAAKHLPTSYIDMASGSGTVKRIGGLFLYLLLLAGFLKVGSEVDRYLGTLGLSAAQTGRNLGGEIYSTFRAVGALANGASSAVRHIGSLGQGGRTQTAGLSAGDARQAAAIKSTVNTVQNAAGNARDGHSSGVDAVRLSKESLGAGGMQEALKAASDSGVSRINGEFAKDYAEGMLNDNGIMPEGSKIKDAGLEFDKDGSLKAAGIRYTDPDGMEKSLGITAEEPENGVFRAFSDELGNTYYAQQKGDADAAAACDACSNGGGSDIGYAVNAAGNITDKNGSAILAQDYPDMQSYEEAVAEKGCRLTESENTVPFDTGAAAYLYGADPEALKAQCMAGDDARFSVCSDSNGEFSSFNLYDGMGSRIASGVHRTENAGEAAAAAESSTGFAVPAGDGAYIVGNMNGKRTMEYDGGKVTLPDGSVITGDTFDFDRTSVNGHMPQWKIERPDGRTETMGPVKAERLCSSPGAEYAPGPSMHPNPDSDHTVHGNNVLYSGRDGHGRPMTNAEADERAAIYSRGPGGYGKHVQEYEKPAGSVTGKDVEESYRRLADTGWTLQGAAFESAISAKYGSSLSGRRFTVVGRNSECRFNEASDSHGNERYTDLFVKFEGMDSAQKITISNDPKSGGREFKGEDGGTYYWKAGATAGKGRPVGKNDRSSGRKGHGWRKGR